MAQVTLKQFNIEFALAHKSEVDLVKRAQKAIAHIQKDLDGYIIDVAPFLSIDVPYEEYERNCDYYNSGIQQITNVANSLCELIRNLKTISLEFCFVDYNHDKIHELNVEIATKAEELEWLLDRY